MIVMFQNPSDNNIRSVKERSWKGFPWVVIGEIYQTTCNVNT